MCSLLSLSGTAFFRGMISKEVILSLIVTSRAYVLLLLVITTCVFITFLYRIIIYKALFNTSIVSVSYYRGSSVIIVSTLFEVGLVVAHST